jgi:5-methylcytosine-specific restriction endonuclease McrBC regulatory subunit McrC
MNHINATPKRHFLSASQGHLSHIVRANRLSRLVCRGLHALYKNKKCQVYSIRKPVEVIFHPYVGRLQPTNSNHFGTSGNLTHVINQAKFHVDRMRGFSLAGT